MSILLIDDSEVSWAFISHVLKAQGFTSIEAVTNAKQAYSALALSGPLLPTPVLPSLILLDLLMPGEGGLEVLRKIKSNPSTKEIPVIVITVSTEEEDLRVAFELGAHDFVNKPIRPVDLIARVKAAIRLKEALEHKNKLMRDMAEANLKLAHMSSVDGLTGLANRRQFDEYMLREWSRALRHAHPISMVLIDIDYFKRYNDQYGHLEGDACLIKVAKALTDRVARYGGEEFVLVLPELDSGRASAFARRVRGSIEALGIPHEGSLVAGVVTVSLGVATAVPEAAGMSSNLIESADKALYMAKDQGRNRVVVSV